VDHFFINISISIYGYFLIFYYFIYLLHREAMMDAEEKTAFYLNIPLFMRNCPHMFLMQQNMIAQQQQMQRQMAGQGAGIRSSEPSTSTSTSASTSIAPGVVASEGPKMMAEMLSDPGSKERLTTLSTRVTGSC
jgi:hypothetical protein